MGVLHVTTPGSVLARRNGSLAVTKKGQLIKEVPLHKVRLVIVHPGAQVTSPALRLVLRAGGKVLWLTKAGRVEGVSHSVPWARPHQYAAQLALPKKSALRLALARAIVQGKVTSQRAYLALRAGWAKRQRVPQEPFLEAASRLNEVLARIEQAKSLKSLRGLEGLASRVYFQTLGAYWRQKGVRFYGRKANPPKDLANAALSYGYGVLRGVTTAAAMSAELLPNPGVLHEDELHYAAIVYDLMEEFRVPAVDAVVSRLLANRALGPKQTQREGEAVYLNEEGRKRLVQALNRRFGWRAENPATGQTAPLLDHVYTQSARLAKAIREETEYHPFHLLETEG